MNQKTEKVVIFGGGVGALSAAVGLVEVNKARKLNRSNKPQYDIHIYQRGWRLGGKCASGRNAEYGERIEEHGLHIWAGFYETAFSIMRTALKDNASTTNTDVELNKLFRRQDMVLFKDKHVTDALGCWPLWFQPDEREKEAFPGQDDLWSSRSPMPSPLTLIARVFLLLGVPFTAMEKHWLSGDVTIENLEQKVGLDQCRQLLRMIEDANPQSEYHSILQVLLDRMFDPESGACIGNLKELELGLAKLSKQSRADWSDGHPDGLSPDLRMINSLIELVGIVCLQMIRYGVLTEEDGKIVPDFSKVDDIEILDFVSENDPHLRNSPVLEAFFEYAFAYRFGSKRNPTGSACSVLEGSVQLLSGYRKGFFFKGLYGMGDLLCTPIYTYLKNNGVHVHFFHNVTRLVPSQDGASVERIEIDQQVSLRNSNYDPLVNVKGFGCWPSEPKWDQLAAGTSKEVDYESVYGPQPTPVKKLTLTHDPSGGATCFNHVIFGISAGSLQLLCQEMFQQKKEWRDTLANLETTRTKAFQLWFNEKLGDMNPAFSEDNSETNYMFGRKGDDIGPIVTLLPEPFDTYSDMSQTLKHEDWPTQQGPKNVAYFCSAMPDPEYGGPIDEPNHAYDYVFDEASRWLQSQGPILFPNAFDQGGKLKPGALHSAAEHDTVVLSALQQQYFRANIDPSERYVLSPPGNLRNRREAGDTCYNNLFFAGDWTKVANMNAGCVECAAMSGLDAAAAISGEPINAQNTP